MDLRISSQVSATVNFPQWVDDKPLCFEDSVISDISSSSSHVLDNTGLSDWITDSCISADEGISGDIDIEEVDSLDMYEENLCTVFSGIPCLKGG